MTYRGKIKQLEKRVDALEEELEHTKYTDLTKREKQVLKKVNDGYRTHEIANMLEVEPSRVSQIKKKLKNTTLLDES
jgi:DNA-binding NarL/FixJ family response regulator